ncbi:hypothetical protein [Rugamonas aquatica]|nr:hypothetical protein [Rugamonas aquatica]
MQTILDIITFFNAAMFTMLAFKLAGTGEQARQLEVAIGKAKALIDE